ncbi:aminopeptidase Ey-like, partial [Chelonoidis abingdonii]|uniref:aminopeptidase Ey-like n=1 Tax=Chelonoidis abingdonii TaxID=106734 RepID=UPI003F4945DC
RGPYAPYYCLTHRSTLRVESSDCSTHQHSLNMRMVFVMFMGMDSCPSRLHRKVPGDWGLVTYRETRCSMTSFLHLRNKWFGNLVTLRWWNDLWLNEGFASYVEYLGADSAEPSWHIKDLIVQSEMYRVMKVDALASSHPLSFLESEINTPAQISEVFDSIAYSKGASVLRMLSEFLTEDSFKKGLQ